MNYRNHSMAELVQYLSNEADPDHFIEGAKTFIQKFVDGNYVPREIHDEVLEKAKLEGYDCGHKEGYDEAKAEG